MPTPALPLILIALALPAGPAAAKDVQPSAAVAKECEELARTQAGAPTVAPRSQPGAAAPSRDTQQQARPADAPPRRSTPTPSQQEVEAARTPVMPDANPRDAYRVAYEACLRSRSQ